MTELRTPAGVWGLRGALAVRLGAAFYAAGGIPVISTEWFLPHQANRAVLSAAAGLALLSAVVVLFLPWQRWGARSMLALSIGGCTMVGAAGWLAPGAVVHYVDLYLLTLVYVGLTQPPGSTLVVLPAAMASYLIGTHGRVTASQAVDAVISAVIAVFVAEALSYVVSRHARAEEGVRQLLEATRQLGRAADEAEAGDLLCRVATELLAAQVAIVYVAQPGSQSRYKSLASRGVRVPVGPQEINIDHEPPGAGECLRRGVTTFVADAASSPLV